MTAPRLRRLHRAVMCGVLCTGPVGAQRSGERASSAPEAGWEQVRLELDVQGVEGCLSQAELASVIDHMTGRPFIHERATVVVRLQVKRVAEGALHVAVAARAANAEPWQEVRNLTQPVACAELLRAAALTISLRAAPQPDPGADAPTAGVPSVEIPGVAAPSAAAPGVAAPSAAATSVEAPEQQADPLALPPPSELPEAQPQSQPPQPLPGGASLASPVLAPRPAPKVRPSPAPTQQPPPQTAPKQPRQATPLRLRIGLGPIASWHQTPGWGLGGQLEGGLELGAWSAQLGASHARSTGSRSATNERVIAPVTDLWLAACFHALERFKACGAGGYSWFLAAGRGFFVDRTDLVQTPWLGAQAGIEWPLSTRLATGPRLDVQVPLLDVELRVQGAEEPFWQLPPVALRLAWVVVWR